MSSCKCDNPTDFRATSENVDGDYLYLRCSDCGGKAGTVDVSLDDLQNNVTDPNDLDPERPEVAEKTIEHRSPAVSIHFLKGDSTFMALDE